MVQILDRKRDVKICNKKGKTKNLFFLFRYQRKSNPHKKKTKKKGKKQNKTRKPNQKPTNWLSGLLPKKLKQNLKVETINFLKPFKCQQ